MPKGEESLCDVEITNLQRNMSSTVAPFKVAFTLIKQIFRYTNWNPVLDILLCVQNPINK